MTGERAPELFFAVLAVALALIMSVEAWAPLIEQAHAGDYRATPCDVLESVERFDPANSRWSVRARYRYVVDGVMRTSTRIRFGGATTSRSPADLPSLPPVGPATCWVRAGHPDRSVLARETDPNLRLIGWMSAGAEALFIYAAFAFMVLRRREAGRVERVLAIRRAEAAARVGGGDDAH